MCDTSAPLNLRLSPLVSGGVYTAYLAYILVLLPKAFDYHNNAVGKVSHQAWLLFRLVNLQRFRTNKVLHLLPLLYAYALPARAVQSAVRCEPGSLARLRIRSGETLVSSSQWSDDNDLSWLLFQPLWPTC